MGAVWVLGPVTDAEMWARFIRRHGRRHLETLSAPGGDGSAPEAVLVINDRTPQSVAHLSSALKLRQGQPDLAVAMLTVLPAGYRESGAEGLLALDPSLPGCREWQARQAAAIWRMRFRRRPVRRRRRRPAS